jgi:hypothetical protein
MMSWNVTVKHRGALAFYQIHREGPGLYAATLVHYRGEVVHAPSRDIVLVRGVRQWTGSVEDETLLRQLGTKIEEVLVDVSVPQAGG